MLFIKISARSTDIYLTFFNDFVEVKKIHLIFFRFFKIFLKSISHRLCGQAMKFQFLFSLRLSLSPGKGILSKTFTKNSFQARIFVFEIYHSIFRCSRFYFNRFNQLFKIKEADLRFFKLFKSIYQNSLPYKF